MLLLELLKEFIEFGVGPKLSLEVLMLNLKARRCLHFAIQAGGLAVPGGSGSTLASSSSDLFAHPLSFKVFEVPLIDGGVLFHISVLQDGLKAKPSVLWL